jgi:GTP cyclohydrolase I
MNRPETPAGLVPIPDAQAAADDRDLAIDQVGVKGVRYPLAFADRDAAPQRTIARCNVFVALAAERKGTHMSRLVALLDEHLAPDRPALTVAGLRTLLDDLLLRLDASAGRIELAFPFFVRKVAPVSGVASLLDYDVQLEGRVEAGRHAASVSVAVPVTALCPCSKEVSEYGAHNQRSVITIGARLRAPLFVADLVRIAEEEASAELYGLLKRVDEKYVTERAYDNPRFVEDLVRGVAARLAADERVAGYQVEAENFESIHNHSAYARIARGW